jgi:spermidine/putrescine-binding protein
MRRIRGRMLLSAFLIGFVTVFFTLATSPFLGTVQAASDKELVVMTWGGASLEAIDRAFFKPFEWETGIKVLKPIASGDMYGRVAAQVRANNVEWDIVQPDRDLMEASAQKGLVEPVDYSVVTDTDGMIPESLNKWGVGFELVTFLVTYNTKAFPGDKHPKSWADFYNPEKFPGPRAVHNWGTPGWNFISALLADGVSPDELTPIDYNRAFKMLDKIKPHVRVWYPSGDKLVQSLTEEEVVMAHTTGARARMARNYGAPTKLVWDQAIYYLNFWSVIKNAPHKETAMRFLNFICRPELQTLYTYDFGSALCNLKSLECLHPKVRADMPTNPDNFKKVIPVLTDKNLKWIVAHNDEMNEKWNEWLSR